MATVTITITDRDIATDDFDVAFRAEGDEIDNGQATAAYFTGYYLYNLVNTEEFTAGVTAFGRELIDLMTADGYNLAPMNRATVQVILEDIDTVTGQYRPTLVMEGGDPKGERLPSVAQLVGAHMRNLTNKPEFVAAVWKYADEFTKDRDQCVVANLDHAPDKAA